MNLNRILKLALTSFLGQGISIITQLLVPPFFIRYYPNGIAAYGEWIALSASISYLGTLNYGIQTYASNETAMLYSRGETDKAKAIQSSAFRLLLILILTFALGGSAIFAIPVGHLLKLTRANDATAALTVYILILQMAMVMAFTLMTKSFMAVGKLHRGNYWESAQRFFSVVGLSVALYFRASFPVLASVQFACLVMFVLLVIVDLRRTDPVLLPSLRYGTWTQTRAIIKPSGYFGLIAIGGFLTWQGPVILIQRILGPTSVATFSLVRVVFQMARQMLSTASYMISQDITLLFGQRNWKALLRLYDLSERVVLFLTPIVSVGSLLLCPFLFAVWLHKRELYNPLLCILMAVVSSVLGIKEHKTQFQSSSNEHQSLSTLVIVGYSCTLLVSVFTTRLSGLAGFMVTWIVWEIIQTAYVLRLNGQLFPAGLRVSAKPVQRLAAFMLLAFGICAWPAWHEMNWAMPLILANTFFITSILAAIAYRAFGVDDVRNLLHSKGFLTALTKPGVQLAHKCSVT